MKALRVEHDNGLTDWVATHQQMVYTFCYRCLNDSRGAKEATQRAFEQAWPPDHLQAARPADALRLLSVAYRVVMELSPRCPTTGVRQDAGAGDVQALLAALPAEVRCVVVLRCCCALPLEEIGIVTGLPLDTVRAHVMGAYRALARSPLWVYDTVPVIGMQVAIAHR